MKKAGIIYHFLVPLARISIISYYRKIQWSNAERVPVNKPVILAVNHPTGFSEPVIMAVLMKRPLYYLVRGDFFQSRFFGFLLRSMNMVPIFRRMDTNFRGVAQNLATFEACYQTLKSNKTICIFPEGNTLHEKKLRPLQKGLGRIAHGALERFPEMKELYVVPVGVSYTYAEKPRSKVMIDFGEPIDVVALQRSFPENRMRMVSELTRKLYDAMAERIVRLDDPQREELGEYLLRITRTGLPDSFFPVVTSKTIYLERELAVADQLREATDQQVTDGLSVARPYFKALDAWRVDDRNVDGPTAYTFMNTLLLTLTAIPLGLGYLFCWPIWRVIQWIVSTKVNRIEFHTPVRQAAGIGLYWIVYLTIFLISILSGNLWIVGISVLLGILGYLSNWWQELFSQWNQGRRFLSISEKERLHLKQNRSKLVNYWKELKKSFSE